MYDRQTSTWYLLGRFLRELYAYKKLLLIIVFTIAGATITTLLSPYILGLAIDQYILPGRYVELPVIALTYMLTLLGQWAFTTLRMWYVQVFGQKVLYDVRNKLFNKLLYSKISFYKDKQSGDLVSRVINDTSTLNEVLVSGVLETMGDLFSLIGIIVAMILLSPTLTLASMVSVPLMIFIARYFGGRMRRAYREAREKIAMISHVVGESVSGIETIKAFGSEDRVLGEFERATQETFKAYMRVAVLMGFFWPLMNISSILSMIVVLVFGGYLALTGAISIGIVVAFIQYVQRFRGPINNLVSMYDSLQSAFASLERIYEILDSEDVEVEGEEVELERLKGSIVFENVWFEYEPGKPVLKNINLQIEPGELIALVGHTGAGKTTLVNLLLRLYDPTEGRILLDGIDIRRVDRRTIRRRISYVPQETYLFPGTIIENIRVGKPEASDEEISDICRELGISEFIERLPKGYFTDAGEAGKRLSLGEKQLISIARAMLRDPDIVVLDEALSSVDPKTEEIIKRAIRRLMKGRTGIIIAHRISTTLDCDRIVVIENGEIVEEGSLESLLRIKGIFYKLYASQLGEEYVEFK